MRIQKIGYRMAKPRSPWIQKCMKHTSVKFVIYLYANTADVKKELNMAIFNTLSACLLHNIVFAFNLMHG